MNVNIAIRRTPLTAGLDETARQRIRGFGVDNIRFWVGAMDWARADRFGYPGLGRGRLRGDRGDQVQ